MRTWDRDWSGGGNSYLAEWGEYERASGWTFERRLLRSLYRDSYWGGWPVCALFVRAILRVSEGRRGRAERFYLTIEAPHGVRVEAGRGKCSSVAQALRRADTILDSADWTERCLRAFYAQRIRVFDDTMAPFATLFTEEFSELLGRGRYVVEVHDRWWEVDRTSCGYSVRGVDGPPPILDATATPGDDE